MRCPGGPLNANFRSNVASRRWRYNRPSFPSEAKVVADIDRYPDDIYLRRRLLPAMTAVVGIGSYRCTAAVALVRLGRISVLSIRDGFGSSRS